MEKTVMVRASSDLSTWMRSMLWVSELSSWLMTHSIDTVRGEGGKSTLGTHQRKQFGKEKEKVKALKRTGPKKGTRGLSLWFFEEREGAPEPEQGSGDFNL
ncbi:unnamed protein product [Brassica rapa]|uniref:Uncharacterized protein n=2 Tax=Brassica TaxID=3705 RepID=A0A8D9H851_BRACM|nr:unnamed protein product [Brassica napus]CAG7893211.1 unnamed protein product [Brassica rapa]